MLPDRLWVADFTYVSTWSGWCCTAFVIDAHNARRILGWSVATTMTSQLVVDAVEQGIWTRHRDGKDLTGLVAHRDHGSQYLSVAYTGHLDAAGIKPSTGAVGSSYDNALAETINGLYKTELIKPRKPWKGIEDLEIATAEWVDWLNPPPTLRLRRPHTRRSRSRSRLLRSPPDPSTRWSLKLESLRTCRGGSALAARRRPAFAGVSER